MVPFATGLATFVTGGMRLGAGGRRGRRPAASRTGRSASSGCDIRLLAPERLGDAALVVLVAGHHEQRVRQAVEVGEDVRADRLVAAQADGLAFGAAADRPGDVEVGRAGRAARQQEVGQRPDDLVELVDQALELLDVARLDRRDPGRAAGRRTASTGPTRGRTARSGCAAAPSVRRSHRPVARATPICEFSSSTVP